MTRHITRALAVTALAALAACSGGGGGTALPTQPATAGLAPAGNGRATLSFTRLAPQTSASAKQRRPNEISFGANSLVLDVTHSGTAPIRTVIDISGALIGNGVNCSADSSGIYQTCTSPVQLPLGADTVTVSTNSARDGSGATLGSATVAVTIKDQQDNPISITLDGVVTSIRLFAADPAPRTGTPENIALVVQLYDASGTVLLAPQTYTQPVVLTDNDQSGNSSLYTQATQNSTQRFSGASPANTSPSPTSKTVSVPDRYTVPYVSYNGAGANPFTVTAAFGSLTTTTGITPASPSQARNAGTASASHFLATVRSFDPVYDATGKLWVTQTGGKIASIDTSTSTYAVTGAYSASTSSVLRTLRSPVLGPDGGIYLVSSSVSNNVPVAPYYITRFDPVTHGFTDFATADEVLHPVVAQGALVGAERNIGKIWRLPFSGGTPGTATEFAVATPPNVDPSPALLPLPTRVFPSSDGNLWVVETSYAAVDGTWLAKYSPSGSKISESLIGAQRELDAQAIGANDAIWFVDLMNLNEFDRLNPATIGTSLTVVAVPRLYGYNAWNEFTQYEQLDANGNLFFISYLDGRVGRVDSATGRVDLLNPFFPGNIFGLTLSPNGSTLVGAGFVSGTGAGTGTYLFTVNT
jgi:hypothetical protein